MMGSTGSPQIDRVGTKVRPAEREVLLARLGLPPRLPLIEDYRLPNLGLPECENRHNHVSAFPAFDRVLCPYCSKTYVRKP